MRFLPYYLPVLAVSLCTFGHAAEPTATTTQQVVKPRPINVQSFPIRPRQQIAKDPSTIVEFYLTTNQGATWTLVTEDYITRKKGEAPVYNFSTDTDGVFGFWTRLLPATGTSQPAPSIGSPAKLLVRIDSVPPVLRKFTPQLTQTEKGITLSVNYGVSDADTGIKSVHVEWSEDGTSWIQEQCDTNGNTFSTNIPARSPFVRLNVCDEAGNRLLTTPVQPTVAVPVTPEPAPAEPVVPVAEPTPPTTTETNPTAQPHVIPTMPSLAEAEASLDAETPVNEKPAIASRPVRTKSIQPIIPEGHEDIVIVDNIQSHKIYRKKTTTVPQSEPQLLEQTLTPKYIPSEPLPNDIAQMVASSRILTGKRSQRIFDYAANTPDSDRALLLYKRLADSDMEAEALAAEVALLVTNDQYDAAVNRARNAAPGCTSDALAIAYGRALLATQNNRSALDQLRLVHPNSSLYMEARYYSAQVLLASRHKKNARLLLAEVARSHSVWAQRAQADLNEIGH